MIDILNNENNEESYSQLKQILKENVKATLSKKKILLSISFAISLT
jgi:hypothetical protein